MRQYLDAKQQHRDAILFFRMGDFYEMFYEDALLAARTLELTLTSRSKDANGGGIPMCGVPFHAVDGYIARLVKKGFRVAICDQVEDPRKAKGMVKREVVRVVSPGTFTDANYLDAREPAFLMAVAPGDPRGRPAFGVALLDVSTGEFTATEYAGAGRSADADRRAGGAASRAKSSCPATRGLPTRQPPRARWPRAGRRSRRPACRSRASTPGRSTARRHAAPCSISCAPAVSKGSVSIGIHGGLRGGRAHSLPAQHAEGRPRARPVDRLSPAGGCLLIDPTTLKHLEIVEGSEGGRARIAARRARSNGDVDGQPAAAVVAAPPAADAGR